MDLAAPGDLITDTDPIVVPFEDNFPKRGSTFNTKWTTGGTNNTWARQCLGAPAPNCFLADSPAGNYLKCT